MRRSYGWDWGKMLDKARFSSHSLHSVGPVLMTAGPWKPIRLETYSTRITDLDVRPRVNEKLGATIDIAFQLSKDDHSIANVSVTDADGKMVIGQKNILIESQSAEAHFKLSPGVFELWYPVGYGKQPIYSVDIQITDKVHSVSSEQAWLVMTKRSGRMGTFWT